MSPASILQSEREDKYALKHRTVRKDHGRIFFAFIFACVVGKNLNTPNLSNITWGDVPGMVPPLHVCGLM